MDGSHQHSLMLRKLLPTGCSIALVCSWGKVTQSYRATALFSCCRSAEELDQGTLRRLYATQQLQSGAEAPSLHSQQSLADEGTLRQLLATQQLQDSGAADGLQREQSAEDQGTLRRLYATQQLQSGAEAHSLHSQQSLADEGTLRQLFATQQLQDSGAADGLQREQSAEDQGTLRRLYATQQLQSGAEAPSLHSQQSLAGEGTLRQPFATQQLQDSGAADGLQREQSADDQGTLRRLFQTQKPTEAAGGQLQQQSTRRGQPGRPVSHSDVLLGRAGTSKLSQPIASRRHTGRTGDPHNASDGATMRSLYQTCNAGQVPSAALQEQAPAESSRLSSLQWPWLGQGPAADADVNTRLAGPSGNGELQQSPDLEWTGQSEHQVRC